MVLEWCDAATVNGVLAGLAQKWNGHGREKNEIKSAQMYCEIELGQLLGPNPGPPGLTAERDESGRLEPKPHAVMGSQLSVPQQRVVELRRMHGHRDLLVDLVREGKRSRRALSQRKIAEIVGVTEATVNRDLHPVTNVTPEPEETDFSTESALQFSPPVTNVTPEAAAGC